MMAPPTGYEHSLESEICDSITCMTKWTIASVQSHVGRRIM